MEDRCICCGTIVPEGYFVCASCETNVFSEKANAPKPKRIGWVRKLLNGLTKKDSEYSLRKRNKFRS